MEGETKAQPGTLFSELRQWLAELEISQTERERAAAALQAAAALLEREIAAPKQEEAPDVQRRTAVRHTTLYRVLRAVAGQTDPDYVARAAVEAIIKEVGWSNVIVALPDEEQAQWIIRAAGGALYSAARQRFPIEHGVIGRAFRTGQTQVVDDVRADPDYIPGNPQIRSELAVPIKRGGRALGVLNLESDALEAFDSEDVGLVESLADAVALALDTAHLYSQAHQNAVNLSALYVVTRVASRSLVLDEMLSQVLSSALALLGFEAGLVGLTDPADGRLRLTAEQGLPPSLTQRLGGDALEETLCRRVCTQQEGLVVGTLEPEIPRNIPGGSAEAVQVAGQWFIELLAAAGFRTYAGTPLLHGGQALGALTLFSRRPRASLTEDLGLLTSIGHQVATAVANAQLFETIARERSRLRALIQASRDGIALVGTDLRVLIINAPALALLGLPGEPDEWVNRPVREMLALIESHAPGVAAWAWDEIQRVQQGNQQPAEGEFEVPPRTLHWLNLPVEAGKRIQGWLLVLRDVTQERSLERMREDLTHTMVHDLRNPLGSIFTSLLLVEKEDQENLAENQRFLLKIARNNAQRMLKIVDDILAVSKLESGRMELQRGPLQLGDLVAGVLRAQGPLAAEKELRLESEAPPALPPAWADAWLMERVLQNLVDNAIKFTPPGGMVKIVARRGEAGAAPAFLYVSVTDNGPGVPADLQQRAFQKFVTGGQEQSGSGLGLAFCKLVVEAHGGRIWVESAPGQGATFTFSLPIVRDA